MRGKRNRVDRRANGLCLNCGKSRGKRGTRLQCRACADARNSRERDKRAGRERPPTIRAHILAALKGGAKTRREIEAALKGVPHKTPLCKRLWDMTHEGVITRHDVWKLRRR